MALTAITNFTASVEVARLLTGIYADVYRQLALYDKTKANDPDGAYEYLKNALAKPGNVRDRLLYFATVYGNTALSTLLGIVTDEITLAQLNTELNTMQTYCIGIRDQLIAGTMTRDAAATDIRAHIDNIIDKLSFPHSPGYTDIWGR